MGEGEKTSLPFLLPSFPFSPEMPDTQAIIRTCNIPVWMLSVKNFSPFLPCWVVIHWLKLHVGPLWMLSILYILIRATICTSPSLLPWLHSPLENELENGERTERDSDACQILTRWWPSVHVGSHIQIQFVYGIVGGFWEAKAVC